MFGIILALLLDSGAASQPAAVVTQPDWLRRPSGEQVAELYPDAAERQAVGGRAVMACSVDAEGQLTDCKVVEESPTGMGFGDAILKMAKYFKMRPMTRDGKPVAGGTIRIPVQFGVPNGRVDDLSVTLKCYGRVAVAADAAPSSEEAWIAVRVWLMQAVVMAYKSQGKLGSLERSLTAAHDAAGKEADADERPTLKECLDAAQKSSQTASK